MLTSTQFLLGDRNLYVPSWAITNSIYMSGPPPARPHPEALTAPSIMLMIYKQNVICKAVNFLENIQRHTLNAAIQNCIRLNFCQFPGMCKQNYIFREVTEVPG